MEFIIEKNNIGDICKHIRDLNNITQSYMSKVTNINFASISKMEHGVHIPRIDTAVKYANALGYELVLRPIKDDSH